MTQIKNAIRGDRPWQVFANPFQDIPYALRLLRRNPGFTIVAVLCLALGIGANTAVFSVIDNLLFRPPPFRHIDRLVALYDSNAQKLPPDAEVPPSPGNFLDWRARARSFDEMAGWRNWYYSLRSAGAGAGPAESVRGVRVSASFFSMLGVDAAVGRTFHAGEDQPGRDQIVVLSHALWVRRFARDPSIVGGQVSIDGRPLTVVGVLPGDFQFYQVDLDLWMPLTVDAGFQDRRNHSVMAFARLASGVSRQQAQSELDGITRDLEREHSDTNAGWGARVVPLFPSKEVKDVRPALMVLLGASAFVLLIACVNVANLLLSRGLARQREIAIRAAIGASRLRLVRQLLTESLVLAALGGALGVVFAEWGVQLLAPLLPHAGTNQTIATFGSIVPTVDLRILAFSTLSAIVTGVVFAAVPALHTTRSEFLRMSSAPRRSAVGRLLVVAELSLAIVLLANAILLLESFWRLQRVSPGFRPDDVLTMQMWLPKTKYQPDAAGRFYAETLRRIERLPGVRAAGAVSFRPFLGMFMSTRADVEGRGPAQDDGPLYGYAVVTPGYLSVIGQRLIRGRDLADTDGPDSRGAVVINETMARQLWPDGDAIGKQIRPGFTRTEVPWAVDALPRWLTVVGVAADIKEFRLDEQPRPLMYVSYRQFPSSFMYLMIRAAAPPETLAAAIQREIASLDPDQPVSNVQTMNQAISNAVPRFGVELLGLFAGIALVLSAIGVYGVTSHGVTQRTREIGIRMALGANRRDMLAMVIRETTIVGVIAIACGVPGALGLSRAMVTMLYGVAPTDPAALAAACLVLFGVALLASYIPARRAASIQPMTAVRTE